jgi:hypothetical protein
LFVHADHLNTPRLVADATGATVWKWDQQEPFGNNLADENPAARASSTYRYDYRASTSTTRQIFITTTSATPAATAKPEFVALLGGLIAINVAVIAALFFPTVRAQFR